MNLNSLRFVQVLLVARMMLLLTRVPRFKVTSQGRHLGLYTYIHIYIHIYTNRVSKFKVTSPGRHLGLYTYTYRPPGCQGSRLLAQAGTLGYIYIYIYRPPGCQGSRLLAQVGTLVYIHIQTTRVSKFKFTSPGRHLDIYIYIHTYIDHQGVKAQGYQPRQVPWVIYTYIYRPPGCPGSRLLAQVGTLGYIYIHIQTTRVSRFKVTSPGRHLGLYIYM